MSPISNADKQDRFRRKQHLSRCADRIYQQWAVSIGRHEDTRTPEEVRQALDKAIELPSGWTESDYKRAEIKLGHYQLDLISSVDQIANDVDGDWESHSTEFRTTSDPRKFIANNKAAIGKARELAVHLISALKLSGCNDADQAAAAIEAVRFIGRSLAGNRAIRQSNATAMCLASVGPQYERPKWFAKQLAAAISKQIDKNLAHEVGRFLQG